MLPADILRAQLTTTSIVLFLAAGFAHEIRLEQFLGALGMGLALMSWMLPDY